MKRWQQITSALLLTLLVDLSWTGVALAQDGGNASDLLTRVAEHILRLTEGLLSLFVAGNVLTEPKGEDLVSALGTIGNSLADFLAQFSDLLMVNTL